MVLDSSGRLSIVLTGSELFLMLLDRLEIVLAGSRLFLSVQDKCGCFWMNLAGSISLGRSCAMLGDSCLSQNDLVVFSPTCGLF